MWRLTDPVGRPALFLVFFGFVHDRANTGADSRADRTRDNEACRSARGGALLHIVAAGSQRDGQKGEGRDEGEGAGHG
jgi:hypothetical protein